jgi:hypothetical protein
MIKPAWQKNESPNPVIIAISLTPEAQIRSPSPTTPLYSYNPAFFSTEQAIRLAEDLVAVRSLLYNKKNTAKKVEV